MKEHHFRIQDAIDYGVECAVILYNLRFWLDKNLANNKNVKDDRVWTYNSMKAFHQLFPYLSIKQIENRLAKLKEHGVLLVGNYNANAYDRTNWYSVNEKGYCISSNGEMEFPESGNGFPQTGEPIPDSNTNNKPNTKKSIQKPINEKELKEEFETFRKAYPGTKRGLETEYALLKKEHPKAFPDIIKRLSKDLETQIAEKKREFKEKGWTAQWKNLQTYIRNNAWEERLYDSGESEQDKMAIIKDMSDRSAGMLNERHLTKEERFQVDSFEKMGQIVKDRALNGELKDFTIEKNKKIQL